MSDSTERSELSEQICSICRNMWQLGWVADNDGNVSALLSDGTILATPSGVSKGLVTPDMLLRVSLEGTVLDVGAVRRPSTELQMHLRCYYERPDVRGVVHAHPPTATAYAVAGKSLDEYSMIETVITLGAIPLVPYATPSTAEVPEAVAPYLARHDALLLQNHGALTVAASVMAAYYRMETLEHFAKISLNAHLLGGAREIPREQIDKLFDLRENYYHVSGRHPGYEKCP